MSQHRLRIGIDMDDTVSNFMEKIIADYNRKYFDRLTKDDFTDFDVTKFIKPECKSLFGEFASYSLMVSLDVAEGAVDALSAINEQHDIFFVTAGWPNTMGARHEWLKKFFPFYRRDMLIGCAHKYLLRLDVMVDDCMANIEKLDATCMGVVVNQPWNAELVLPPNAQRIDTLAEVPAILEKYQTLDRIMKWW